jgi:hypothetical protein
MKLVHLAPSSALNTIRRRGLRGTPGLGVFCVPLAFKPQRRILDEIGEATDLTPPRSLTHLWTWWLKRRRRGINSLSNEPNRRPVAVVFDVPPTAWPLVVRHADQQWPVRDEAELWATYQAIFVGGSAPQHAWECDFDVRVPKPVPARFIRNVCSLDRPLLRRRTRRVGDDLG